MLHYYHLNVEYVRYIATGGFNMVFEINVYISKESFGQNPIIHEMIGIINRLMEHNIIDVCLFTDSYQFFNRLFEYVYRLYRKANMNDMNNITPKITPNILMDILMDMNDTNVNDDQINIPTNLIDLIIRELTLRKLINIDVYKKNYSNCMKDLNDDQLNNYVNISTDKLYIARHVILRLSQMKYDMTNNNEIRYQHIQINQHICNEFIRYGCPKIYMSSLDFIHKPMKDHSKHHVCNWYILKYYHSLSIQDLYDIGIDKYFAFMINAFDYMKQVTKYQLKYLDWKYCNVGVDDNNRFVLLDFDIDDTTAKNPDTHLAIYTKNHITLQAESILREFLALLFAPFVCYNIPKGTDIERVSFVRNIVDWKTIKEHLPINDIFEGIKSIHGECYDNIKYVYISLTSKFLIRNSSDILQKETMIQLLNILNRDHHNNDKIADMIIENIKDLLDQIGVTYDEFVN
jgi:hypothetical protein